MRWLLFITCLSLAGCPNFIPHPPATARAVTVADLVGTWTYDPYAYQSKAAFTLRADGTFGQVIVTRGKTIKQEGTWVIVGTNVQLDGLHFMGDNATGTETFKIIDKKVGGSPTGFALFGGTHDPDAYGILPWSAPPLMPAPAKPPSPTNNSKTSESDQGDQRP